MTAIFVATLAASEQHNQDTRLALQRLRESYARTQELLAASRKQVSQSRELIAFWHPGKAES